MNEMKSEFLKTLDQYHFDRTDFSKTFIDVFTPEQMEEIYQKCIGNEQTDQFVFLYNDDEYYLIHTDSGTIINWYKHLGRTNTCNKKGFELDDLKEFLQLIKEDLGWD